MPPAFALASAPPYYNAPILLTNGANIIGLLSTPEYIADEPNYNYPAVPVVTNNALGYNVFSNHIVAYVRALSGLATEKPPQDNQLMVNDAFTYRMLVVNAPVAMDSSSYDAPYNQQIWKNQRELRLSFFYPVQPNGSVGPNQLTFRTTVAGTLLPTFVNNQLPFLYFYPARFVWHEYQPMNDMNPSRAIDVLPSAAAGAGCRRRVGFSLIEVLVVVTLLSLIILVLMTVFNSTQSAFRAGVTQTDVLEGSRAAMDLVVSDLKLMSPSDAPSNNFVLYGGLNFFANLNNYDNANYYLPLIQNLPGSNQQRTNVLEDVFWVSRQNINGPDSWVGTGYTVIATNSSPLFPLYRFVTNAPVSISTPTNLFIGFQAAIQNNAFTNNGWSHLIDGVLDFRVQPFDLNGYAMTNSYQNNGGQYITYPNTTFFLPAQYDVTGFYFISNAIPGSVEIQMSTLEDAVLRRAESFGVPGISQSNYLAQQAGRVHVFRQRVILPNVDPSAYP